MEKAMAGTNTNPHQCAICGNRNGISRQAVIYQMAHWRAAIMSDTPKEVWALYAADGIGLLDAVAMEASYGG